MFYRKANLGRIPDRGNWQTSHAKGWHSAIILALAGLEVDAGGFTAVLFEGGSLTLSNLSYQGRKFSIAYHLEEGLKPGLAKVIGNYIIK